MSTRALSILVLLIAITWPQIVHAKSVYCVTHQNPPRLYAYDIVGDQITLAAQVRLPYYGYGAIDVAIDCESGILFITSESNGSGGNQIILVNARTLQYIKTISLTNGELNLSGIVVDEFADRVYAVDRDTNRLYTYFWDRDNLELTLDAAMDNPVLLPSITYANGITLDERDGTLYAAEFSYSPRQYFDTVKLYNRHDAWSLTDTIDLGYSAVDVELDTASGFLYAGAYDDHDYLLKKNLAITDPADPDFIYATDIGANIAGIAVDPESGLVYATTYRNGGAIEVWDTSNWPLEPNAPIAPTDSDAALADNGPAGICVPRRNIGYQQPVLTITKTDDVGVGDPNAPGYRNCVSPGDEITYTIAYNPGYDPNEFFDAVVTDRLPNETFFVSANPDTGLYDIFTHTYTWEVGDLEGWDPNYTGDPNYYLYLTVQLNPAAEPLGHVTNYVEIESFGPTAAYSSDREYTPVCCWGGDIIYVDQSATGFQTGTTWQDAYRSLRSALDRAANSCASQIWVANGVYAPGNLTGDAFALLDGVAIYGGFAGHETELPQRNFPLNPTVLTGRDVCTYVVTAQDVDSTAILDGFVIQSAVADGIYCANAEPLIANCLIKDNDAAGLYCTSGAAPTILDTVVKNNDASGIQANANSSPVIDRSNIHDNAQHGIYINNAAAALTNSWVHHNGTTAQHHGVYLFNPSPTTCRNNTIAANMGFAVSRYGGAAASLTNCILWHNNSLSDQFDNCTLDYSCYTDPNHPDGGSDTPDANHNITANPLFAYPLSSRNLHLASTSPCIDMGDNGAIPTGDLDIDNDERIYDGTVEMGADELACTGPISHPYDLNADGIINLLEYALVAKAWLSIDPQYATEPNQSLNWDARCDLDYDHEILLPDLASVLNDWLWQACWRSAHDNTWMTVVLRDAGGLTAEPLAIENVDATIHAQWLAIRPPYAPTLLQEIWQLEDLITWAADLYVADENVRQNIPEEEYKQFLDELYKSLSYVRLQHYLESTGAEASALPEDFEP